MKEVKSIYNGSLDRRLLDENFNSALKDDSFRKLIDTLSLDVNILKKYTSILQDATKEIENCKGCKGLEYCKNSVTGCIYTPQILNNKIIFSYEMCKYLKEYEEKYKHLDNVYTYNIPSYIKTASFDEIYVDDKNRVEIIKYIKSYFDNYFKNRKKGLYVSGNFGSGKSYIIASLFNELAKKDVKSAIIYFPEFLRSLKTGFDDNTYQERFEHIKKIPLLLIDDIGADVVTPWGRDEILGSILQYRMEEDLATFFTSNLTLEELENHLSISKDKVDKVKARRIIERIKYLADEMKLISVDRRK